MRLDIAAVAEVWWMILLAGAIMTAIKVVSIGGVSWALGATPAIAAAVGLALAQGGEFGLILIGAAQTQGILDDELAARVIAIIIISLILTPALVAIGKRLQGSLAEYGVAPWIRQGLHARMPQKPATTKRRGHVIIGGYGPTGRVAARTLDQIGMGYSVVELNPETVRGELRGGRSMIYGDVKNPQVLESAGLDHADALILTMPDELAAFAAVAIAKRRKPDIYIVARVSLVSHGRMAKELGADYIVIEEVEVAKALQEVVMERFGGEGGKVA
jgi:CPA2 family monovalent cation:H+ antiporter-2